MLLLRSLATARVLRDRAATAKTALVVGSGFIGCEAAASLAMRGVDVTLVSDEDIPHASRLGEEAGRRITGWLEAGVDCAGTTSKRSARHASTATGEDAADLILMAGGVQPRAGLAETAGLDVRDGRIVVDERMRTSAEGVYAAGDVALAHNTAAGRHLAVEHWGEALNMGEIAGRRIAGDGCPMGRRARLLVDDRRAHAQVRRVGRRLRRGAPGRTRRRGLDGLVRDRGPYRRRAHPRSRRGLRGRAQAGRDAERRCRDVRACVVVPARDEEDLIGACITALAAQAGVARDEYEVILVLDRCTDATAQRAAQAAAGD